MTTKLGNRELIGDFLEKCYVSEVSDYENLAGVG